MKKTRHKKFSESISLLIEIIFITIVSVWIIKYLRSIFYNNDIWMSLSAPVVLISAAVIPTILRKNDLSQIGFLVGDLRLLLKILFTTCLVVFTALVCGVLLLNDYEVPLPLSPIIPEKSWIPWLFFQFLSIAVPEEVFFRGYLQSNVMYLLDTATGKKLEFFKWGCIIISALVFAASHVVIIGNVISIITFFPGLIFGWLFFKTKSLLAPVIFHGLANIGYGIISAVFA